MMFFNPHSYDDLKVQLQERMNEREAMRPGEIVTRGSHGMARQAAGRLGGLLVRIGTWIEQTAQPAARDSHGIA